MAAPERFEPTLASLRSHQVPGWYDDAKLGIFVHWTMASVPAFAPREHDIIELLRERYRDLQVYTPYVEWYENSLRFPESPVSRFHREHYGDRAYASFRGDFVEGGIARLDPDAWADAFAAAGARYVVLVTKHHDGFCLWPSRVANPHRDGLELAARRASASSRAPCGRGGCASASTTRVGSTGPSTRARSRTIVDVRGFRPGRRLPGLRRRAGPRAHRARRARRALERHLLADGTAALWRLLRRLLRRRARGRRERPLARAQLA